jgi:adenosine deaminase CECR1
MVGKADMGLAGWKQLVLWSLEHSCMSDAEKLAAAEDWEAAWEEFLLWVLKTYDEVLKVKA